MSDKFKKGLEDLRQIYDLQWNNHCLDYPKLPSILPKRSNNSRIIVIGDLHGDFEITIKSLQLGRVLDDNYNWIGGDTIVVQVGDQIDRCRSNIGSTCDEELTTDQDENSDEKILRFLTDLHNKAQKKGGAVYSLLGNHELMNVQNDMRYVSYKGIKGYENYKREDGKTIKDGLTARKWLFRPGNPLANFLACTRKMVLVIGSLLFVHAGILPEIVEKYGVEDLNKILVLYLWDELKESHQYDDVINSSDYSPLWNRVVGMMDKKNNKNNCYKLMNPLKNIYHINKMFVGHTPQINEGINSNCDNRVWYVDYGGSKAFDKFDLNFKMTGKRGNLRKVQVLQIWGDGNKIEILK